MDIVKKYIQKFEAVSKPALSDPYAEDFQKLKEFAQNNQFTEASISVDVKEEDPTSMDPFSGSISYTKVNDTLEGFLYVWQDEDDGTWSWEGIISSSNYSYHWDGKGSGIDSLDNCLAAVKEWASYFEDFSIEEIS